MKTSLEEAVAFHQIAQTWMEHHMKELLPPHLFGDFSSGRRGSAKSINRWLQQHGIEVQTKRNGGVRIIKGGMLYAQLKAPQPEPNVALN